LGYINPISRSIGCVYLFNKSIIYLTKVDIMIMLSWLRIRIVSRRIKFRDVIVPIVPKMNIQNENTVSVFDMDAILSTFSNPNVSSRNSLVSVGVVARDI